MKLTTACGKTVLVDDDMAWLARFKWCLSGDYPSHRKFGGLIYLHWYIIGKPLKGFVTDHINRDKLDARRDNLRIVSQLMNMQNSARALNRKGVSIDRTHGTWKAYIDRPGLNRRNVGTFQSRELALAALESFQ